MKRSRMSILIILLLLIMSIGSAVAEKPTVVLCMTHMREPAHWLVQLGFLEKAQALGYLDARLIGTEGDDWEVAADLARNGSSPDSGLLLWNPGEEAIPVVEELTAQGTRVGLIQTNDQAFPAKPSFRLTYLVDAASKAAAVWLHEKLAGQEGYVAYPAACTAFAEAWTALEGESPALTLLPLQNETPAEVLQDHPEVLAVYVPTQEQLADWAALETPPLLVGTGSPLDGLQPLKSGQAAAMMIDPFYELGA